MSDSRRHYLELARLERLGDASARATLRGWPGGALAPLGTTVEMRAPVDADAVRITARTPSSVLLAAADNVYLLDSRTLEEQVAIRAPEDERGPLMAAALGDEVLIGRGRTLALHDRRGARLARCELGGRITRVDVRGDRALVCSHRGNDEVQVFLLDVGDDFGRRLHTRVLARLEGAPGIFEGGLFPYSRGSTSYVDLATGRERKTGLKAGADEVISLLDDSVPGRALARWWSSGRQGTGVSMRALDDGRTLWEAAAPGPNLSLLATAATEELVLASWGTRGAPGALVAYGREDGVERWSSTVPDVSSLFVSDVHVTAVGVRPHLVVRSFDLATGSAASGGAAFPDLTDPNAGEPRRWLHQWGGSVVTPGGLVILGFERSEPRLVRIEPLSSFAL